MLLASPSLSLSLSVWGLFLFWFGFGFGFVVFCFHVGSSTLCLGWPQSTVFLLTSPSGIADIPHHPAWFFEIGAFLGGGGVFVWAGFESQSSYLYLPSS
jgi:hypothetical protein